MIVNRNWAPAFFTIASRDGRLLAALDKNDANRKIGAPGEQPACGAAGKMAKFDLCVFLDAPVTRS
jgi:hypothetical protein